MAFRCALAGLFTSFAFTTATYVSDTSSYYQTSTVPYAWANGTSTIDSGTTAAPYPDPTPECVRTVLAVNLEKHSHHQSADGYVAFVGNDAFLVESVVDAASFELKDGQLKTGGEFVGTSSHNGHAVLEKFASKPKRNKSWQYADESHTAIDFANRHFTYGKGKARFCVTPDDVIIGQYTRETSFDCRRIILKVETVAAPCSSSYPSPPTGFSTEYVTEYPESTGTPKTSQSTSETDPVTYPAATPTAPPKDPSTYSPASTITSSHTYPIFSPSTYEPGTTTKKSSSRHHLSSATTATVISYVTATPDPSADMEEASQSQGSEPTPLAKTGGRALRRGARKFS